MKDSIKLIRPQQWIKNLFVLLPAFFGHEILFPKVWGRLGILFFAFSFASSAIYVFNDIYDRQSDRNHPKKRYRPIASGKVSLVQAYILCGVLLLGSLSLMLLPPYEDSRWQIATLIVGSYVLINIVYSLWGKHWPVLDAFFVAAGFVLRVEAGGAAAYTEVSHWLFLMILFLSLLLAFGKRQEDLKLATGRNETSRPVVKHYSPAFLQSIFSTISAILIVLYTLYCLDNATMEQHSPYLYTSIPLVALGLIYYLRAVIVEGKYYNPTEMLYKDRGLQIIVLCWGFLFILLSYVF